MKILLTAAVLAAFPVMAISQEAGEREARCRLVVEEKTYIDGDCMFRPLSNDGGFVITSEGAEYFAYVNKTPDGMFGTWNEEPFAGRAHTNLGILERDGACWKNEKAEVCAWAAK